MKHFDTFVLMLLSTLCFINIHVMGQDNTGSTNQTTPTKLRFVVPKRDDLSDFVKVTLLNNNGTYIFSGFSIEVFREAAKFAIPSLSWDFTFFDMSNGTFDHMLDEVEAKEYDGAVGEITILKKRMETVDFTMPYLDTRIGMLVRVATRSGESSEASLTPATKVILVLVGLLGSAILVAVVFWIWELCKDSHGSSSTQQPSGAKLGSIMHARLVIILALMVLLLTIASYAPHQSSSLPTDRRLVSDIKSLADVRRRGLKVGYRQGAFVKNMLVQKEGFLESQLVQLDSEVIMLHKLQIGTENGGIDALVAGVHHLKLFQSKYCKNFTLVPDFNLKSTGLGFAFPQNQDPPLVKAFSEAIVTLIDNGKMKEIQASTIGDLDNICEDDNDTIDGSTTYQDGISLWLPVASAIFVVVLVIAIVLAYCGTLMRR